MNEENNIHLQILMTTLQYTYSRHTVKFKTVARLGKQQLPGQAFLSHKGVQKGPKLNNSQPTALDYICIMYTVNQE